MAAMHESILKARNAATWHPSKKSLFRQTPARFYDLHPNPKRMDSFRQKQYDRTISDIMKNINYKTVGELIKQEGLTPEEHHHFDPLIK